MENNNASVHKKRTSKKHKHGYSVLPYFLTPIVFVLISMIIVIPVSRFALSSAIDVVHKAQKTLCLDYNELEVIDEYKPSTVDSGSAEIFPLSTSQRFGTIKSDDFGLNAKVYYGVNRVSLRNGAACNADFALPGQGKPVRLCGYSSTCFKSVINAEKGDIITFDTSWGIYKYRVVSNSIHHKCHVSEGDMLVLTCSKTNKAFSAYKDVKRYIVAEHISGLEGMEVIR